MGKLKTRERFKKVSDIGPIREESTKEGTTDAAKLGKTVNIPTSRSRPFSPDPTLKRAVFIFKYAPESWLRAKGIIRNDSQVREYIDVDAPDHEIKAEQDTKVGITQRLGEQKRVFWDSEGEIEVIKYLVPVSLHGTQLSAPLKAEDEAMDEFKVEEKIQTEMED
ncbi:unnamed protein product [Rhizoctonia solani]|uniref:Uncharacterized protein n=1 Tax=Rhizoctonia solani TaxID=456999 RepID=A0A8H3DHJ1_9AGAM|nr:unnamed protein product [Rhizoctonia solani]